MSDFFAMIVEFMDDMAGARRLAKRNKVPLLASSVAFFSIFSLCPMLIVSYVTSRALLRTINTEGEQVPNQMKHVIDSILPSVDPAISQNILEIIRQNALNNAVNLALLVWSAYQLFGVLHYAFDSITERGRKRNAYVTNLISLVCFLVIVGSSSFLLILSTVDSAILKAALNQYLGSVDLLSFKMMAGIFGALLLVGSIAFIYKLMPSQHIRSVHAFRGAVMFLLLFLIGRSGYQLYANYYRFMNEGTFGPFFTFIMVIVWIYYLSRAFLFSAQYVIYLEEKGESPRRQ